MKTDNRKPLYLATAALAVLGVYFYANSADSNEEGAIADVCPQYAAIEPKYHFNSSEQFLAPEYKQFSVELLSGAVQIPSESFDDMAKDPTKDERFLQFGKLHEYLDAKFPLASKHKETVNVYGLLYTFKGSDESLEPILYMAHQDVVPVNHETWDQWEHPPFSGEYDGEFLYGRGSCDTKNTLVAQLEAIENLLQQGWKPKRTVVLSYGYDEECDGSRGAKQLAKEIEYRYGRHGVKLIVDEGDGIERINGKLFALPAVAEKGIVDFNLEMLTPGGHSSLPPPHTGIGIIASLVTLLESNPLEAGLEEGSVWTQVLGCIGRWNTALDANTRSVFTNLETKSNRDKAIKILDSRMESRYLLRTSQAVDVVSGGVKVNALPEKVTLQVDHRIAVHQSIGDLKDRLTSLVKELSKQYDISAELDGQKFADGKNGLLNITSFGGYEPAPISPTSGEVWESLAGVTKHLFGDIVFGPSVMIGNTDTGNYWQVSKNIYRYNPCLTEDGFNIHTVNEKLRFQSHLTTVQWFYDFTLLWTQ